MPAAFGALVIIYLIILLTGLPPSVTATELFSPFHWSAGRLMPTIGHALLLGLLVLSAVRIAFRSGRFNKPWTGKGFLRPLVPGLFLALGFILFLAAEAFFRDLVLNSSVSFEAFRILDMTFMSLAGLIAVVMLLTVPVLLFMRAIRMMREWPRRECLTVTGVTALLLPLACLLFTRCSFLSIAWVVVMLAAVILWQRKSYSEVTLMILFSLATGLYTTSLILRYSDLREERNMKVMAVSLANDNDMVAEGMLIDIWPALESDTVLARLVRTETVTAADINAVYRYLEDGFFLRVLGEL